MFWLDKMVLNWIIKKCADLGSLFFLGPVEGAIMYTLFIAWIFVMVNPKLNNGKKAGVRK